MWLLLAPLGKPSRFSSILCNWNHTLRRQLSGPYQRIPPRRWTEDEDRKLADLRRQGFSNGRMSNELSGRSMRSVAKRLEALKGGADSQAKQTKCRPWSVEEETLLMEKRRQGVPQEQLARFFPGRTYHAVATKYVPPIDYKHKGTKRVFTDGDVQRMIDMRVKEAKSIQDIATALDRTYDSVKRKWYHLWPLISNEAREIVRSQRHWTTEETKHLHELHSRGTFKRSEVMLHFPSKSRYSVHNKIQNERLSFPGTATKTKNTP